MSSTFLLLVFAATLALACLVVCAVLARANRVLQKKLAERKADLDRTSKILIEKNLELVDQNLRQQKQLESKDDFIHIVSHQLRTPATEIKWHIDALLSDAGGTMSAGQRQSLDALRASIGHMIELINHIVHLVSIEEGATYLAVVPYDPNEVVRAAVELIAKQFPAKHIHLTVATDFTGVIDALNPESLSMVVNNLVENAFLYTKDGGAVAVCTKSGGGACNISISDTGVGMSPEQQKSVFVKFRRGASAIATNARGSGLGLYIVKKILDQHKGEISFVSTEGEGSTFTVSIPAAR